MEMNLHMKMYLVFVLGISTLFSCSPNSNSDKRFEEEQKGIAISGKVEYPQDQGWIILQRHQGSMLENIDTILLNSDGSFSIEVIVDDPNFYRIDFYQKQIVDFILHNEAITVNADGNSRSGNFEILGSSDTDFYKKIMRNTSEFQSKLNQIGQDYRENLSSDDPVKIAEVENLAQQTINQYTSQVKEEIEGMGTSVAAIYSLEYLKQTGLFKYEEEIEFVKGLAQKFKDAGVTAPVLQEFYVQVENISKLGIGMPAPEITLPNTEGKMVSLSSLRGKYVLIDFWAAWCRPCRIENPNVVKLYAKYQSRGFEIFGVSLDRTREAWIKAIRDDGLTWPQVSDLKYWESEVTQIYNIRGIPLTYLVDPDGIIIGKNLRGPLLEKKLEEIFG